MENKDIIIDNLTNQTDNPLPTTLYKYLEEQYAVPMLERGNIRLGTLYEYRDHWNDQVRDPNEGNFSATQYIDSYSSATGPVPGIAGHFFGQNVNNLFIAGSTFIEQHTLPNRNIYCATEEASENVMHDFNSDVCVEITNPKAFFQAILRAILLNHHVDYLITCRCTYDGRSVDYIDATLVTGHPVGYWVKDPSYILQKEVRTVFFFPDTTLSIAPIIIDVPEIIPLIRRYDFNKKV